MAEHRDRASFAPANGATPAARVADTDAPAEVTTGVNTGYCPDTELPVASKSAPESSPAPAAPRADATQDLLFAVPGSFGDYELLQELGRGGMGVVYKARQKSLDRLVALKMVRQNVGSSDQLQMRLGLEAKAAATLDHPNIVPVYEVGVHSGCQYFTMAYVEGETLAAKVTGRCLPVHEAARVVQVVAEAMECVHRRGILHRDLKPSNILMDGDGRPRVSDFGLAKQVGVDGGLTATGQVLGTPQYMSPEQVLGNKKGPVGPLSDVYALGGILYFTLTGAPPFSGDSVTEILVNVVQDPPIPIRQVNPSVPEELEAICLKCLSKKPEDRFPSAGALAQALRPWAFSTTSGGDQTESVTPILPRQGLAQSTGGPGLSGKVPTRRRFPVFATAMVGIILCAVGIVLFRDRLFPGPEPVKSAAVQNFVTETDLPAKHDFGVTVDLVGSVAGPADERLLDEGRFVSIEIKVERDAYVGIWMVKPNEFVQLFPNRFEMDNKVLAGVPRIVPGNDRGYDIKAVLSKGPEKLRVVASTHPWDPVKGEKDGPFAVFQKAEDVARLRAMWRDLVIEPRAAEDQAVAEIITPFRVRSRAQ